MRANLPVNYRGMFNEMLGNISFDFYHRWFDFVFLPSAICTIVFFLVVNKAEFMKLYEK
jgi:hypothetical protein